jgi:hypothetical protein
MRSDYSAGAKSRGLWRRKGRCGSLHRSFHFWLGEQAMDWEQARYHVQTVIGYRWAVGKREWAEALELCLAKADRCQAKQDVVLDLRQRLEQAVGQSGRSQPML